MYRDPFYPVHKPNPSYPPSPSAYQQNSEWQYTTSQSSYLNPVVQPPDYHQPVPFSPPYYNQPLESPLNMSQIEQEQSGNGFLEYFYDGNGQLDIDKMLSTVGQVASIYHQVSPIIKQFGSFMKNFTTPRQE
ncbi:MAG TPA: YppG family protein [Cerasibacillus sp.]|uniref:YppG family protein n=1 Tax=Cerasibacillus sp. TaxID=2498711 RepID=UPI002F403E14